MSENKFRGKSVRTGGWIYGYYVKHENRQTCPIGEDKLNPAEIKRLISFDSFADWNMPKTLQAIEVIPETVGQYTGLKDKSGKEICEGDIVRLKLPYDKRFNTTGTIVFDEETVSLRLKIRASTEAYVLYKNVTDNMEIIGNIHENPELLK